jgi:HNH endonuclease
VAQEIPKQLLDRIKKITAKRPRTVLQHILVHGFITTEELKEKYGYNHPPRAARDVVEQGIPLKTDRVEGSDGRKIAAYRLDLDAALEIGKAGRIQIPKGVKKALIETSGPLCSICGGSFDPTFLQVDHKVPYQVAGEPKAESEDAFMLVCASCNRTKSWACEHCRNWTKIKKAEICEKCYWASPTSYQHVAMIEARRADVTWLDKEVPLFDRFRDTCKKAGRSVQDGIKRAVVRSLE